MAVNFPSNPTNGQTITVSGITYAYDSTQGVWSDNPQGLTQAIDALTDVDTSTSAPTNGQILQWNSTDSEWQPADADAGVTVYATIDDLPLTGVTEGSMALVDSTDKLYIYSDTGWYSISIVNQTPTISGVSATYALATDGTATTVTVTATDPEGIPLTYSIVSDTSGSVATVAQGTGSNTNQWTITPSTNTADAGSFTLVFRASDGTNIASASSTFSLVFGPAVVQDSNYTTALITSVGANNAVNNSFTDSSSNSHAITAYGNVTQNTFSPYRHGGYSHLYRETVAESHTSTLSAMGSSAWTIEAWFYRTGGNGSGIDVAIHVGAINSTTGFAIGLQGSTTTFRAAGTTDSTFNIANTTNRWIHFAFVYDGTDLECFANGSSLGTVTRSLNITDTTINIGYNYTTFSYGGYIKDVRVSSVARYSSTFDVPTESFTSDTDTLFLLNNATLTDDSSNAGTIGFSGAPSISAFSPYDREEYDAATHGGSIYFDGSGDYAGVANDASLQMGTGDFTFEWWWNPDHFATMRPLSALGTGAGAWSIVMLSSGTFDFVFGTSAVFTSAIDYEINKWTHIAVVRESGTVTCYVNGVSKRTASNSYNQNATTGIGIGYDSAAPSQVFKGSLADVRIVKGTAVYTSAFTPPTAPLTAITNTSLLLNGTNAGIIDKSQSAKTITLNGNVKSSTAQTKYLTSSMSFAAQTDFLTAELPGTIGTGDFTIEWWAYFTNINPGGSNYRAILDMRHAGDTSNLWLQQSGDGSWSYYPNYPTTGFTSSTFSNNTWHHIAIARENGTIRFYVDGSLTGSGSDSFDYDSVFLTLNHYNSSIRRWTGYASDLRVTKGLARYTASDETANIPSAALEG